MTQERDIRLYMFLRLAMLFSVLVSLVIYQRAGILSQETIVKTYFVTFFTFLVTTGFTFTYEKAKNVRYFLTSQFAYDILFTTVLTFYTGANESMYTVFYLLNILFAAVLFPRTGALVAAVACALLYGLIAWLNSEPEGNEKITSIITTVTGFVSLALLAGQLVEELRRSRQRISRLEQLSEEIVNSLDSGLLALNPRGEVERLNRTGLALLGIEDHSKVIGKPLRELLPGLGEVTGNEMRELGIQGQMRKVLITKVDLPESHSMILLRDLTEVLDLEDRVRRQERLAGVGRLATGVAHEIRNPIASISGAAQILASASEDADERSRLTNLIVRESERVDRLVNQLLRFAKPTLPQRTAIRMDEILEECVEMVQARPDFKDIDVEFVVDVKGPLQIQANRDEMTEVVTNLLVNSMQAFAEHDSVRSKRLTIEGRRNGRGVEVRVSDNGPGIPREFRNRIFDPFFTTKAAGTGLGLAQVHKIVRDHNGEVDLETEEGKGTALTIRLPA